ncbi:MAG: HEAT repeat domain-containing protein, partial [Planctomycetes bacterium]|nr:HEAT repeat domain-containing protein [Planctomycetota bacterium]
TYLLEHRLDELEKRAVTAAPPAENKDDTPTLDAIISDRTNLEDDTQPTKPPVEPVNAITPDDGTAAPQEATNDDPPPDESGLPDETPAAADADIAPPGLDIGAIVAELKKETEKLVAENRFSKAIAMLESRPDIREPLWQADRELMRRKIHKLTGDFHTLDVARARRMVREGRIEDARKVYRQIIVYGMPDMVRDAEIRVTALAGMPDKQPEPDADAPPAEPQPDQGAPPDDGDPRVAKCIAQLSDRDAAHHVRTSAAKKLGELRAKAAVDALIAAMDARDWYLRVCAANALEQIGDVRAVPALVNNLDHTMIPVNQVARKALVKLTGNDFGMDGRKWQEWWNAEGMAKLTEVEREKIDNADPPEVIEIPAEPTSFASQIVLFKEDQQSVTFTVNANSGLSIGQKVDLKRNDKAVATVEIAVLAHGTATARLVEVAPDTTLKAGDMVGVHK